MHHLSANEGSEVAANSAENQLGNEISNENEIFTDNIELDDGHADAADNMRTAETEEVKINGNETIDIEPPKSEESDENQMMLESAEEPNETNNTSDHNERDTNFENGENGIEKVGGRNFQSFQKSISIRTILDTFVYVNLIYVELIEMQRTIIFL